METRRAPERVAFAVVLVATGVLAVAIATWLAADRPAGRLATIDAAGRLVTMDARGATVVAHAVSGTTFQFPVWSPDATRIAAIGQSADGGGVYVFRARGDGTAAPVVAYRSRERPPFYAYWTPDGRRLTFLTQEPDGLALRLAAADAAGPDTVIRRGAPLYWAWLDGGRLEVHSGLSGPDAFLGEIAVDGLAEANAVASAGVFRAPAVSADGRHRAYAIATSPQTTGEAPGRVVLEARDGSARHEVPVYGVAAMGFDPTGSRIAFIAGDEPAARGAPIPLGPLRVADATGTVRTILDGDVVAFFWAPDGRTIVSLRVGLGGGLEASASTAGVQQADGIPLRLGFTDVTAGRTRGERPIRVSPLFAAQVLPYFDQYALSHRVWSPDSRSIALPLVENGELGLYVVPADGSEPVRVADATIGFWSP